MLDKIACLCKWFYSFADYRWLFNELSLKQINEKSSLQSIQHIEKLCRLHARLGYKNQDTNATLSAGETTVE